MHPLKVAAYAFESVADASENMRQIQRGLIAAAEAGARVLVVPECALSGYPGAAHQGFAAPDACAIVDRHSDGPYSFCALADHEDLLHPRPSPGHRPGAGQRRAWKDGISNHLFVCGAVDEMVRYRKRHLTPLDEQHFLPGEDIVSSRHRRLENRSEHLL